MRPSLDAASLDDLKQRVAIGGAQPQLAGAHGHLSLHVLGVINHALDEHRPNRNLVTLSCFLWAMKLWNILMALLHLPDGPIKMRQRFALVESGHTVLLLPWIMAYKARGNKTAGRSPKNLEGDATLERASFVVMSRGRSQSRSTRPSGKTSRSGGNEETWATVVANFPPEA